MVGFAIPYLLLTLFVMKNGFDDLGLSIQSLFVNGASAMLTADLLISSLVFWVWLFYEGGRLGMKHLWAYVAANLLVGLSLALPLFLYYRAAALEGREMRYA